VKEWTPDLPLCAGEEQVVTQILAELNEAALEAAEETLPLPSWNGRGRR
jgi:hypothetical protein